jgi:hypothetical protein
MSTLSVPVLPALPTLPDPLPRPERGPRPQTARGRASAPRGSPAGPPLPAEGTLFPWLAARFLPGEATVWTGPSFAMDRLLELLYAGSARAGGRISLIEGANRFDPYRIAEGGRPLSVDPETVLEGIRLARAFTAYQLVALVDGWSREARDARPTLLVGHDLPALFEGEELPAEERVPLLTHVARTLRALTERTGLPLLLTVPGGPARFPGLTRVGPRLADVVDFKVRGDRLRLVAYRERAECWLVPRPPGQHGLEQFAPIVDAEVMAWDAPPRPTGRRWKSG